MSARTAICFVVSSPMTAEAFLTAPIRALSERCEVHLVVNAAPDSVAHPGLRRAQLHRAGIERAIAPLADLRGLVQLMRIFRRERFAAVHSVTPKAGLLTAIAAWIARVPVRVHTYTGQVWVTRHGPGRWLLKRLDALIARLDTHLLADSVSQRDFLRRESVLGPTQGEVLHRGSVSGVDSARFKPDPGARAEVRGELGIPPSAPLFLFVGRLTRDKGVLELASAFEAAARSQEPLYLLLVGPDEDGLAAEMRRRCPSSASRLRFVGWTDRPERYMAAADVFCLPSHREGFGTVILEAAAAGLPAIGSRIYGVVDAIEDGRTGLLVDRGDAAALAAAMSRLAEDAVMRAALAQAARARALRDFSTQALSAALVSFYEKALQLAPATARASPRRDFD